MGLKTIVAPTSPFSLETLRLHARIPLISGSHPDDALLPTYAAAAREYAQHYAGVALGSQTVELALDEFPPGAILLPMGPVQSVVSLTYVDVAQDVVELVSSAYSVDLYSSKAWVTPAYDTVWPEALETPNAVKVRYITGDSELPDAAKAAILLIFAHLYNNREQSSEVALSNIPLGAHAMLDTIRSYGF